ncbi:MAG: hypothetical protein HOQ05_11235 [Corynebacteriales bacterium]|nr:hypothetical protein [Mycobacteriales bacterium]
MNAGQRLMLQYGFELGRKVGLALRMALLVEKVDRAALLDIVAKTLLAASRSDVRDGDYNRGLMSGLIMQEQSNSTIFADEDLSAALARIDPHTTNAMPGLVTTLVEDSRKKVLRETLREKAPLARSIEANRTRHGLQALSFGAHGGLVMRMFAPPLSARTPIDHTKVVVTIRNEPVNTTAPIITGNQAEPLLSHFPNTTVVEIAPISEDTWSDVDAIVTALVYLRYELDWKFQTSAVDFFAETQIASLLRAADYRAFHNYFPQEELDRNLGARLDFEMGESATSPHTVSLTYLSSFSDLSYATRGLLPQDVNNSTAHDAGNVAFDQFMRYRLPQHLFSRYVKSLSSSLIVHDGEFIGCWQSPDWCHGFLKNATAEQEQLVTAALGRPIFGTDNSSLDTWYRQALERDEFACLTREKDLTGTSVSPLTVAEQQRLDQLATNWTEADISSEFPASYRRNTSEHVRKNAYSEYRGWLTNLLGKNTPSHRPLPQLVHVGRPERPVDTLGDFHRFWPAIDGSEPAWFMCYRATPDGETPPRLRRALAKHPGPIFECVLPRHVSSEKTVPRLLRAAFLQNTKVTLGKPYLAPLDEYSALALAGLDEIMDASEILPVKEMLDDAPLIAQARPQQVTPTDIPQARTTQPIASTRSTDQLAHYQDLLPQLTDRFSNAGMSVLGFSTFVDKTVELSETTERRLTIHDAWYALNPGVFFDGYSKKKSRIRYAEKLGRTISVTMCEAPSFEYILRNEKHILYWELWKHTAGHIPQPRDREREIRRSPFLKDLKRKYQSAREAHERTIKKFEREESNAPNEHPTFNALASFLLNAFWGSQNVQIHEKNLREQPGFEDFTFAAFAKTLIGSGSLIETTAGGTPTRGVSAIRASGGQAAFALAAHNRAREVIELIEPSALLAQEEPDGSVSFLRLDSPELRFSEQHDLPTSLRFERPSRPLYKAGTDSIDIRYDLAQHAREQRLSGRSFPDPEEAGVAPQGVILQSGTAGPQMDDALVQATEAGITDGSIYGVEISGVSKLGPDSHQLRWLRTALDRLGTAATDAEQEVLFHLELAPYSSNENRRHVFDQLVRQGPVRSLGCNKGELEIVAETDLAWLAAKQNLSERELAYQQGLQDPNPFVQAAALAEFWGADRVTVHDAEWAGTVFRTGCTTVKAEQEALMTSSMVASHFVATGKFGIPSHEEFENRQCVPVPADISATSRLPSQWMTAIVSTPHVPPGEVKNTNGAGDVFASCMVNQTQRDFRGVHNRIKNSLQRTHGFDPVNRAHHAVDPTGNQPPTKRRPERS